MKPKSSDNPDFAFYNDIDLLSRLALGVSLKELHNARVTAEKLNNIDRRNLSKKH